MLKKIEAWLVANPGITHVMEGLLYAMAVADWLYLKPLLAGGTTLSLTVILAGIGNAAFIAAKLYIQTTVSQNQGVIIAQAQDLLDQIGGQVTPQPAPLPTPVNEAPVNVVVYPIAKTKSAAMTLVKMVLFAMGVGLLASSAFADSFDWIMPSTILRPERVAVPGRKSLTIAGTTINGVVMPTASLGLATNPNVPSYGGTAAYDFVLGQESPVSGDATKTQLTPLFGVGLAFYVDFAPWVNSGLQDPVLASGGFNVIGPQIGMLVPSLQKTWNFVSGDQTTLINFTAFFNIFPTATIIPIF